MRVKVSLPAAVIPALSAILAICASPVIGQTQGWSREAREGWYWGTQGSRLMPFAWFDHLETASGDGMFADPDNLASFGFLAAPEGFGQTLPIGFAKDRQADATLPASGLRWYEGQRGDAEGAEAWIGLNCSACHTAQMTHAGTTITVEGGPNLLDFQLFVEELDRALAATRADPDRWERFAAAVLAERDTPANRVLLDAAFDRLLAWQEKTDAMNETPSRYGFGRLDAVGHIYNKVLMFNGAETSDGNPSDAPVSYPFLWNIWKQSRVQWNGIAQNSRFAGSLTDDLEYGALGRNTGEVLGVFGDIEIKASTGPLGRLKGFTSSVQVDNLERIERMVTDLEAPAWPDAFPPIDAEAAERGANLFAGKCASCHLTEDPPEGAGTERMITFEATLAREPENLTDIWMACNAWIAEGPTGPMRGLKAEDGTPYGPSAPVAEMLGTAVKGALIGKKSDLVAIVWRNWLGVRKPPAVIEGALRDRESDRTDCMTATDQPLLAYKARPLDGIWATAPYLHNGSVASLHELLLPAEERLTEFWTGNREFDPENVGYVTDEPASGGFLLQTRDTDGKPIDGNSNAGHDYGAGSFTDAERRDLVEYLKSL